MIRFRWMIKGAHSSLISCCLSPCTTPPYPCARPSPWCPPVWTALRSSPPDKSVWHSDCRRARRDILASGSPYKIERSSSPANSVDADRSSYCWNDPPCLHRSCNRWWNLPTSEIYLETLLFVRLHYFHLGLHSPRRNSSYWFPPHRARQSSRPSGLSNTTTPREPAPIRLQWADYAVPSLLPSWFLRRATCVGARA